MKAMEVDRAVSFVQAALAEQADSRKVADMQAYMKTDMPFYGVQKPGRVQILRRLKKEFAPLSRVEYEDLASALWELPHREEKYLAQAVATAFPTFIVPDSMSLYRRFIVEGAWWDFVDEAATHMVRALVIHFPQQTWPIVDRWIDDEDMWLRRSAILSQVGAKEHTDVERLFRFCAARADEKEFFIRKAIGWALREYSKTDPAAVARFVTNHREDLSRLSYREATKHLGGRVG